MNLPNQNMNNNGNTYITADQVVKAFKSFGFEPNQGGMNDVGYWTTRPLSDAPKLMDELKKKRIEENKKREGNSSRIITEFEKQKRAAPLSDEEILSLYDEYGFPKPDTNWVRENLPNDEEMLRKILTSERKIMDKGLQKTGSQLMNQMGGQNIQPQTPDGLGAAPMMQPGGRSKAFFVGGKGLVKFSDQPNHVWLVDSKSKTLRPFLSDDDFENYFDNPEAAKKSIVSNISTSALKKDGLLGGYKLLGEDNAVNPNEDGQGGEIEGAEAVGERYGKPVDEKMEEKAWVLLDGFLKSLIEGGEFNPEEIKNIINDPQRIAFYLNALAYGDYSLNDVGADIKNNLQGGSPEGQGGIPDGQGGIPDGQGAAFPTSSLQPGMQGDAVKQLQDYLVSRGYMSQADVNTGYGIYGPKTTAAVKALQSEYGVDNSSGPGYWGPRTISAIQNYSPSTQTKTQNIAPISPSEPKKDIPSANTYVPGGDDFNSLPISYMPDDFYATAKSKIDINSDEFKDLMSKINTTVYDIAIQQVNAQTEQQKALADTNWNTFKQNLEKTYGWKLSDNAVSAYGQLKQIYDSYSNRGIQNTGLQNENIDDQLRSIREQDRRNREALVSEKDEKLKAQMIAYGSPEEIKRLNDEDSAKGLPREQWRTVMWGLSPSSSALDRFNIANLKSQYGLSDAEAQRYHDMMLDENGNYRSTLYQNKQEKLYGGLSGSHEALTGIDDQGNPIYTTMPGTGGLTQSKTDFAKNMALQQALDKEAKEKAEFTKNTNVFSQNIGTNSSGSTNSGTSSILSPSDYAQKTNNNQQTPQVNTSSYDSQVKAIEAGIKKVQEGLKAYQTTPVKPSVTPTNNTMASTAKKYGMTNYSGSASDDLLLAKRLLNS